MGWACDHKRLAPTAASRNSARLEVPGYLSSDPHGRPEAFGVFGDCGSTLPFSQDWVQPTAYAEPGDGKARPREKPLAVLPPIVAPLRPSLQPVAHRLPLHSSRPERRGLSVSLSPVGIPRQPAAPAHVTSANGCLCCLPPQRRPHATGERASSGPSVANFPVENRR